MTELVLFTFIRLMYYESYLLMCLLFDLATSSLPMTLSRHSCSHPFFHSLQGSHTFLIMLVFIKAKCLLWPVLERHLLSSPTLLLWRRFLFAKDFLPPLLKPSFLPQLATVLCFFIGSPVGSKLLQSSKLIQLAVLC